MCLACAVEEMSECTNITLELLILVDIDWPLKVLTSISVVILLESSWRLVWVLKSKGKDIFTEIHSGTTIWDSNRKERSNISKLGFFFLILTIYYIEYNGRP